MRSGRDGQAPSGERRADAVRRTRREGRAGRGAVSGDEAPHGVSRMRAAGADARRTAARPRSARKAEGPTRRTRPGIANAARFGAAAGRTACRTRRVGQDCGLRLTSRSPHGRQDAQVARPEARAPLPRSTPHVGKRQDAQQLIVAQGEKHLFMLKPGPRDSMMMTCARLQPPEAPNLLRGFVRNRPRTGKI